MIPIRDLKISPTGVPITAETAARITRYFERELRWLADARDYRKICEEFERDTARAKIKLDSLKGVPIERLYQEAAQYMARIYDKLGRGTDVWLANRDWKGEAGLLAIIADSLEDRDKLIVDAGCGTGIDICALASLFPTKQFIGYDISREQIELARERIRRNGNENIKLFAGGHRKLPQYIEPNSVDVAYFKFSGWEEKLMPWVIEEANIFRDKAQEIQRSRYREIRRVLKNNGAMVIIGITKEIGENDEFGIPDFEHSGFVFLRGSTYNYVVSSYTKIE